jgi:hypothetical protein
MCHGECGYEQLKQFEQAGGFQIQHLGLCRVVQLPTPAQDAKAGVAA